MLAPSLYSPPQVKAWSQSPDDYDQFWQFIFNADTYLLLNKENIIGFCGLKSDGHIASFYVAPNFTRQGNGTKLLNYVLCKGRVKGITKFYTEASFFSQPVFSRCGFMVVTMEIVNYGNVLFERYKMEKIT